jgi:hypothetical protein
LYLNDKGEREQKHFFVEEMPPRSIAEYESKLAKEKITSAAASLRITAKVIASSATPVPATNKGPRPRLTNTQVESILAKRDSNAYSGNVEPHYKTTFLEGGVHKTEWLEVCELPVKKLAYFEAELSKEEEEQEREIQVVTKRDRATRSRGPPSPIPDLPFSDDVDEEEEEEEEEEDSEDSYDKDFIASEDKEDK